MKNVKSLEVTYLGGLTTPDLLTERLLSNAEKLESLTVNTNEFLT